MGILEKIFSFFKNKKTNNKETELSIYHSSETDSQENIKKETVVFDEFHSIWEYLSLKENSQAFFVSSVVGFEEWVSMEEILRRIEEIFGIKFKNKRSLYPYIKTMVDLNLLESLSVGDKMKWRKKETLIKLKKKKEEKEREARKETVN
ncbi:MAG: hypothetical protein JW703_04135 [Candidatus Diapherotrites archaeon]|nr:hypothetical protein [Candidatus Diapherotrites archaeon]